MLFSLARIALVLQPSMSEPLQELPRPASHVPLPLIRPFWPPSPRRRGEESGARRSPGVGDRREVLGACRCARRQALQRQGRHEGHAVRRTRSLNQSVMGWATACPLGEEIQDPDQRTCVSAPWASFLLIRVAAGDVVLLTEGALFAALCPDVLACGELLCEGWAAPPAVAAGLRRPVWVASTMLLAEVSTGIPGRHCRGCMATFTGVW